MENPLSDLDFNDLILRLRLTGIPTPPLGKTFLEKPQNVRFILEELGIPVLI